MGPVLAQGSPDHRPRRASAISISSDRDSDDGLTLQPSQLSGIIMQQLASPRTLQQQQQLSLLRHQATQRMQHQQLQQEQWEQQEQMTGSQAEAHAAASSPDAEASAGTATASAGVGAGAGLSAVERWQAYRLTLEHLNVATVRV